MSEWDVKALFNRSTIYIAPLPEVQAGLRTGHITTVAITTACRNATHLANLHTERKCSGFFCVICNNNNNNNNSSDNNNINLLYYITFLYFSELFSKSLAAGIITAITNQISDALLLISIAICVNQCH